MPLQQRSAAGAVEHAGDLGATLGVASAGSVATARKWYSVMATAHAILGRLVAPTDASGPERSRLNRQPPEASRAPMPAGTTRDERGGNQMMHLRAMRAPGPARPQFVASQNG